MLPTGAWLAIWSIAVVLGGILSALAQSLRDVARPAMEALLEARGDNEVRGRVGRILEDMEGHAVAVALPRIILNLLAVVGMVMWVAGIRGQEWPGGWELGLGIAGSAALIWIAGVAVPAAVARHAAEVTVATWSTTIRVSYILATPVLAIGRLVDGIVRRMAGRRDQTAVQEVQEEILHVVEEAQEEGTFDKFERDMVEAVLRFPNTTVAQIMTPRTEMEALPATANLGQVVAMIRKGGHSRIPVYDKTLDSVLGFFYIKDLMKWLAGERGRKEQGFDLRMLLRPALFVPESKTVRDLLQELLAKRIHIAIVADEFGGTAGLATLEDIFEEVFGDIRDEYELPDPGSGSLRIDEEARTVELDARAYVDDVNPRVERLGIRIPASTDYDTVGGFVVVAMGRIPVSGETVSAEGVEATVLEAEATRVTRVRLRALPTRDAEGEPPAPPAEGTAA